MSKRPQTQFKLNKTKFLLLSPVTLRLGKMRLRKPGVKIKVVFNNIYGIPHKIH